MTRIEKAVKIVSDLYEFYRRIPKIAEQEAADAEGPDRALQQTKLDGVPCSPERPSIRRS
jgi:hypothetical protein